MIQLHAAACPWASPEKTNTETYLKIFSYKQLKNICRFNNSTPDMNLVYDIFTFVDSGDFYVAYRGKSNSCIFLNSIHWNYPQFRAVDSPLSMYTL